MGASLIVATDIADYRLRSAKKFGADTAISAKEYSPGKLAELNQGRLMDLVIVSTGAISAIAQALASVERGGTVLFFAPTQKGEEIPIPFNALFWRNEITLTSSYAGSPSDYKQALDLLASRKLNASDFITHRLSLSEITRGFKLVAEAKECLKVVIKPGSADN